MKRLFLSIFCGKGMYGKLKKILKKILKESNTYIGTYVKRTLVKNI